MGGKQKGQRTKGNVRPSNSGRAAELLTSGSASGGFIGFGVLPTELSNLASPPVGEEFDSTVDGDFRMVMRKMTKKDATTKLKAVQEFATLCTEQDLETLKGVIPFWPRLFNKLCLDHDRRVREATQIAHQQLIQRIRKHLAPHLRNIMGCWLMAQCDPYALAASAARTAFETAFPPAKQPEAFLFCKNNIISTIQDNLFHQTAESLSDPKSVTPEEMQEKYHRVLSCSLLAWKLFLNSLPKEEHLKLEESYNSILINPCFWKLVKINSSAVKGAFFSLIASLCQVIPEIAQNYAAKLCLTVLGSIDIPDVTVSSQVWEAVMYVILNMEDWSNHINIKKALLPKLWIVLQNGGYGCAVAIFPCLLPLLSKFLKVDIGNEDKFYQDFFNSLKLGLSLDKVRCSRIECNAIITAFMECLQFIVTHTIESKEHQELQKQLILDQLMPVVEASLLEPKSNLQSGVFYTSLTHVLHFWNEQTKCKTCATSYVYIQDLFWNSLCEICIQIIDQVEKENKSFENLLTMIHCFGSTTSKTEAKKKCTVKFALDKPPSKIKPFTNIGEGKLADNKYFLDFILLLLGKSYDPVEQTFSLMHLKVITELFSVCKEPSLYIKLLSLHSLQFSETDSCSLYTVEWVIMPWINKCTSSDRTEHLKALIDLVFAVYSQASIEEKEKILNNICQNKEPLVLCYFLEKVLELHASDILIQKWLKGPELSKRLVNYAEDFCYQNLFSLQQHDFKIHSLDISWKILSFCLSTNDNFETFILPECMDQIVNTFHRALPKPGMSTYENQEQFENCVNFVCNMCITFFSNFKGCLMLSSARKLLLTLFEISCQSSLKLQESLNNKVQEAWQTGLKVLLLQTGCHLQDSSFISQAVSHIKDVILNKPLTIGSFRRLLDVTFLLLQDVVTCLDHFEDANSETLTKNVLSNSTLQIFLNQLLPTTDEWSKLKETNFPKDSVIPFMESIVKKTGFSFDELTDLNQLNRHSVIAVFSTSILLQLLTEHEQLLKMDFVSHQYSQLIDEMIQALAHCEMDIVTQAPLFQLKYLEGLIWCKEELSQNLKNIMLLPLEDNSRILIDIWKRCQKSGIYQLYVLRVLIPYLSNEQVKDFRTLQFQKLIDSQSDFKLPDQALDLSCLNIFISASIEETSLEIAMILLQLIMKWKEEDQGDVFLHNCNIPLCDINSLNLNLAVMDLMSLLVCHTASKLSHEEWDFILCRMVSWIQTSCEGGNSTIQDLKSLAFCGNSCSFLCTMSDSIKNIENLGHSRERITELSTEWQEFFSEGIYSLLLPLFLDLCTISNTDSSIAHHYLLEICGRAMCGISSALLKSISLPLHFTKLMAEDCSTMPDNLQTLLNHLCPMLISPLRVCQLTAFKLLFKIVPDLPAYHDVAMKEEDKDPARPPPLAFKRLLEQCELELSNHLDDELQVCICHAIEPDSQIYIYTMAYLLLWKLLLHFFGKATAEMRAEYAIYLRESKMVTNLLLRLFCLMPENPLIKEMSDKNSKICFVKNMFTDEPFLQLQDDSSSLEIQHMVCSVYYSAVKYLPIAVRQWWNNQDKRVASIVDKFTTKYVSPFLCTEEIQAVKSTDVKIENMTVKARPAAREVVATYSMAEVSMELIIQLPLNHPLGPITLNSGKQAGVIGTQWRNWMLQLMTFLTHQNGSILDGLVLWKRNVDKQFEGLEDCMICFSVIHGTNCQLPKLSCRTCKKKFHPACLYKWFNTSNNNSCPLCRNLW